MVGSKTTRFVVAREVDIAALAVRNRPPLPLPQNIVHPETVILLHPDSVRASQLAKFIQLNPIKTLIQLPIT